MTTCALAVVASNVSALLPPTLLANLHKTRLGGSSVEQLYGQVAELREQTQQLQRENAVLMTRLALGEKQSSTTAQRVGALEVSLPNFLESFPGAGIDYSARTAGIGNSGPQTFTADGGTVTIRQIPLPSIGLPDQAALDQPLPLLLDQPGRDYGVAIGPALSENEARAAWNDFSNKLGPLLLGLMPLLNQDAEGGKQHLVVGPLAQLADATALCGRLERVSIACAPMSFTGIALKH